MPNIWPAQFPQDLLFDSFAEQMPSGNIRTEMGAGPDKIRKRSDANYRRVTGEVILTTTQVTDLVDFYENTLTQGTDVFDWKNMITQNTQEFRFREPPSWSAFTPNSYRVSLNMEQITT